MTPPIVTPRDRERAHALVSKLAPYAWVAAGRGSQEAKFVEMLTAALAEFAATTREEARAEVWAEAARRCEERMELEAPRLSSPIPIVGSDASARMKLCADLASEFTAEARASHTGESGTTGKEKP